MREPQLLPQAQAFIDYLYEQVTRAIQSWDDTAAQDIYAIWLVLSMVADDARFTELSSIVYCTNTHITLELAGSSDSRWSPGCVAGETELNLCHPSDAELVAIYGIEDKDDPVGRELRDAYLNAVQTRFNFSEEQHEAVYEHSRLMDRLNLRPLEFTAEEQASLEELNEQLGVTEAEKEILQEKNRYILYLYGAALINPFLQACGTVIRRLHTEGVLEKKCGHPVPVGITFSNDVDLRTTLEVTRDSNPAGLSQGMEEWMLGRTYEQIEAEAALLREVESKTPAEQAQFWAQALLEDAEWLYLNKQTPIGERFRAARSAVISVSPLLGRDPAIAAEIISLLIPLIESRASAKAKGPHNPVPEGQRGDENDVASSLLMNIETAGRRPKIREAVSEADVERLHRLLVRLFRDCESLNQVGMTTALTARALHYLRPYQYPQDKFGTGGDTGGRLLNYRAFGLAKSDPNTPDYDEAYEEARRATARQARLQKLNSSGFWNRQSSE